MLEVLWSTQLEILMKDHLQRILCVRVYFRGLKVIIFDVLIRIDDATNKIPLLSNGFHMQVVTRGKWKDIEDIKDLQFNTLIFQ